MAKVRIKKKIIALTLAVSMVTALGYTTPVQATELDGMTISANDVVDEEVVENPEVAETTEETEVAGNVELNEEATLSEIKNSPVLTVNTTREGDALTSGEDENWYQFTLTERGYFSMDFSVDEGTDAELINRGWNVHIYKGTDDLEKAIKEKAWITSDYTTPIMSLGTGTYYIKVDATTASEYYAPLNVPYDLRVNFTKGTEWEQEANDNNTIANTINVNKQYKGNTHVHDDVDWYKFTTEANGYFEIKFGFNDFTDINNLNDGWNVNIYNSSLELIRSYPRVKTSQIQNEWCSNKLPFKAGTYYVEVTPFTKDGNHAPVDCYYNLEVKYTATNSWEAEENNDRTTATELKDNIAKSGLIIRYDDVDWYCINVAEKGKINWNFQVDASTKQDAINDGWHICIYDSEMKEIAYSPIKSSTDFDCMNVNAGKYYIRISNLVPSDSLAPVCCIYHIKYDFVKATARTNIEDFVSRMYTVALNRDAEAAGLKDWSDGLESRNIDGAGIASGFINSVEFNNRYLSNSDFVDTLYQTFFNREPDAGGKNNWMSFLNKGGSRNEVLAGFVNSQEFSNLCDNYGIARGTLQANGSSIYKPGVRDYVLRMYTVALNRNGETVGVEDWTNRINTGSMSAEEVAKSFFSSQEFLNRNLSNEDYVETLYETFMGRSSDAAGKADWVGRLNAGTSRQQVLEGFSRSAEFGNILRSYGL